MMFHNFRLGLFIERTLVLVILKLCFTSATWWLMGTDYFNYHDMSDMAPGTHFNHCETFPFFVERQKFLCLKSGKVFSTIKAGAKLWIEECQFQMKEGLSHRWDCSVIHDAENVFGQVLSVGSREKAYVHAISAAGLAYQVTKACAKGELEDCSCDEQVRSRNTKGKWQWGGCSEDVNFGALFSKEFADSAEDGSTPEGLMNLHNNEAGRRLMKSSMNMSCKCHGVSGSCTMKVCWRVLHNFRSIGKKIAEKFEGAFRVRAVSRGLNKKEKGRLRLKPYAKEMKKPTRKDLVFIEESPDYCEQNQTLNVLGTKGRVCNRKSSGPDGCQILCCGRGYQTLVKEGTDSCNCQFIWCCRVQCDSCPYKRDEHVCN